MMGHTHQVINAGSVVVVLAIAAAAGETVSPVVVLAAAVVAWATARWPDVTNGRSRPGRRLARCVPELAAVIQGSGTGRDGHRRGWSHALATGLVLAGVGGGLAVQMAGPSWWWMGAIPGMSWMLHVLADCLTWDGAAALLPLSRRVVRPRYGRRIECGGRAEQLIVIIMLVAWMLSVAVLVIKL